MEEDSESTVRTPNESSDSTSGSPSGSTSTLNSASASASAESASTSASASAESASASASALALASASASASASISVNIGADNDGMEEESAIARRRLIRKMMSDRSLTEKDRRLGIQALMDGSSNPSQSPSSITSGSGLASGTMSTGSCPILGSSLNSTGKVSARSLMSADFGASNFTCSIAAAASEEAIMTCVHYEAKCNIVAPCCNRVFGCRVCHDEMTPQDHPAMDRFQVTEIVCKDCHTRQPRSNKCVKCQVVFAEYHCNLCNIWMDLTKQPFHCHECGFCRVGGKSNFRHCHECCMCISNTAYSHHSCLKDKYKNSCPVCREDMHTSRLAAQDLPCGHAIHSHCLRTLANFDYRCPICKKSVMDREAMQVTWERRAVEIAQQPMPEDLRRKVDILCNDCDVRSENQDWHFLGARCTACGSFNTVVDATSTT